MKGHKISEGWNVNVRMSLFVSTSTTSDQDSIFTTIFFPSFDMNTFSFSLQWHLKNLDVTYVPGHVKPFVSETTEKSA